MLVSSKHERGIRDLSVSPPAARFAGSLHRGVSMSPARRGVTAAPPVPRPGDDLPFAESLRDRAAQGRVESAGLGCDRRTLCAAIKESCLDRMIVFGEGSLRRAIGEFVPHSHYERNHQGRDNHLLIFDSVTRRHEGPAGRRERLRGLLKYDHRRAAQVPASDRLVSCSLRNVRESGARGHRWALHSKHASTRRAVSAANFDGSNRVSRER
jgi:hypothetical protein